MLTADKLGTLNGRRRWLRVLAIALALLAVAQLAGDIALRLSGCGALTIGEMGVGFLSGLAFTAVGLLIAFYHPRNRVGWLMIIAGFGLSGGIFYDSFASCRLSGQMLLPGATYVAWFSHRWDSIIAVVPLFVLLPFVFPTGHFLTPRWRWLALSAMSVILITALVTAFAPDLRVNNGFGNSYPFDSPIVWRGLPDLLYERLFIFNVLLIIAASLAGIASLLLRLKRSQGIERQQLKWFTYFLATAVTVQLVFFEFVAIAFEEQLQTSPYLPLVEGLYMVIVYVVFLGWPLVIGLAIFRYRLYDIDIIIRRTLVYSLVTLALGLVYFGSVVLLQRLFTGATGQGSPLAIVLSTLLIAALFNPLRRRVQDLIDRRFYRQKYDAQQVLARFARTARDETDKEALTTALLQVVQETMQPASVVLWLKE